MAPEVIQQAGYDFKADIWSLGITAMELVNGEPPNASTHPMKVLFLIPKAPAPRLEGNDYSRDFKDFIAACLVKDPDRRPTAKELLQHRFIKTAGRVETLQELIQRRQAWDEGKEGATQPKFYEETLRPMSVAGSDEDWVFDTVKAPTIVATQKLGRGTHKARKPSLDHIHVHESPEDLLDQLTLEEDNTGVPLPPPSLRRATTKRRSSPAGAASPAKRRSSGQRLPLGPSTSFGNGSSTMRQFQRVSSTTLEHSSESSLVEADENQQAIGESKTNEAFLGRRAYAGVIDQAFQEVYAQTADQRKRDAISKVALAWDSLDKDDPEGEYLLLKLMIEKVQK